ncbi:MAG: ABC transporter ATP-binding protein [Erysipelotrichaceae bacterium]|jgi:ABC-type sugar transport system ATPase subunit|nr:ABC transporter ATP-binding protein [Erysipelotrichaceae bacterium]
MKVVIENLSKRFEEKVILENANATFASGEISCILGPSGGGKSTLLNLIAGLLKPDEGKIYFDKEDVTGWPPAKRHLGYVFQEAALFDHLKVKDNIALALEIRKLSKPERQQKVEEAAGLLHISDLLELPAGKLSGGQKQRVAIARALIIKPSLLLLDEPLAALDQDLKTALADDLSHLLHYLNITTLWVSHDLDQAARIAKHLYQLKQGTITNIDN